MLGRTGVAPYGRRCSWAHSEGHIGVAHYGILVGGPFQLRWQPIGRRCLWAYLGEVPTPTICKLIVEDCRLLLEEIHRYKIVLLFSLRGQLTKMPIYLLRHLASPIIIYVNTS